MTAPLPVELRKRLEQAVRQARRVGEAGARAALHGLAVPAAAPHGTMTEEERELRRRLRARGRQLRDGLEEQGVRDIDRLTQEVAYEHWHRMLFARFLAENGLLIEPDSGVAVTLEECAELARGQASEARRGVAVDGWSVAERFAARMLPEIFRPDDPALEVTLAPESRQALEKLVTDLPTEVFTASDSLGWTYQFWQADRKAEVNDSEVKIGADELPAVTQLFTENYMVRFLLHNTVGAWRAARILAARPDLARSAASEAELAEEMRIPATGGLRAYKFEYLRFVREGEGTDRWRPAAGGYSGWPGSARELRVLDPCCGSGHFLVEALELLARLRMEEEGLCVEDALRRVIAENLFGLELDLRCTQIAVFSLGLAAWKMAGRHFELPQPNVACSGVAVTAKNEDWLALARGRSDGEGTGAPAANDEERRMRLEGALDRLHGLFEDASALGSLIDPKRVSGAAGEPGGLYEADYEAVAEALEQALRREDPGTRRVGPPHRAVDCQIAAVGGSESEAAADRAEWRLAAAGISRAARFLVGEYDLVITNVPYLRGGSQVAKLQQFVARQHPDAKTDLATAFVSRGLGWLGGAGAQAVVVPQNWLFLKSYRKLRERLLDERTWRIVARLGPGAFETISGEVVNVALVVLSGEAPAGDGRMVGIDVSAPRGERPIRAREKADLLRAPVDDRSRADSPRGAVVPSRQRDQRVNPNSVVLLIPLAGQVLLGRYTYGHQGIATADYACFGRKFWEMPNRGSDWEFQQSTVRQTSDMGGREHVLHWVKGEGPLQQSESVRIQGGGAWTRDGIAVSQMGSLPVTRYTGEYFDNNVAVLTVTNPENLPAVWCFCSSEEYGPAIRQFDQVLKVTNANLVNAALDLDRWRRVAAERYPNGLPEPYSDDPTQWLFHGHPCGSVVWSDEAKQTAHGPLRVDANVLQIGAARLLGYRWPSETDRSMRLAAEVREWVERAAELAPFADADGIVCLHAAAGEAPAAERLRALLRASYGEDWSAVREEELLAAANEGIPLRRQARSLDDWLRDHFFAQHVKLFQNRPFIWHIWDGRSDGFHALVNCHRLCGPDGEGRRTLEALAFRHLGDWIARCRAASSRGEEGAEGRLAAALDLQRQLEHVLEGDPPCDLFIRWRPLHEQPIGWAPHLDDGVRLNIRPFVKAELQIGGVAGAGLLRARTNVKWEKADRGKEPVSLRPRDEFPWFYGCPGGGAASDRTDYLALGEPQYDGKRWNDLHYTRETKEEARARHEAGSNGRGEQDA